MKENRRDRRTFLKTDGTNGTEGKKNQGRTQARQRRQLAEYPITIILIIYM